jgi:hypothetical protein
MEHTKAPIRARSNNADSREDREFVRKPYVKPAFQCEKVFETMALACGKTPFAGSHCRGRNAKNS